MGSKSDDNVNLDQDDSSNSEIRTEPTSTFDDASLSKKKEEKVIPLMSEELDVIKTELVDEAIITKESVKETKTEQIPLMHEELVIERRPVIIDNSQSLPSNNDISTGYENEELKPIETNTKIKIPLKREETEVTKKPYIIEELLVRKKAVTKTQTVSEEIITERIIEPEV
jgi:uncharacterized protein (TIGR02271 family)